MDEKIKKASGEKNTAKKLVCIIAAIIVILAVCIGIGIYNSEANQLKRHLDLGQKYLDELDYEQAVVEFGKAIEIDPKCADAYLGMAGAYAGMGDYESSLKNFDKVLELDGENERVLDGLGDCLREYIDFLLEEKRYEEIKELAEKYGNLAVDVDFRLLLEESEESGNVEEPVNEERETAEAEDEELIQVTIKVTDIKADSVFNTEGYGSLQIQSVGDPDNGGFDNEAFVLPQAAMVDAGGNMVFPYQYTYQRYRVSDNTVSLTESSPYSFSFDQEGNIDPPIYCRLDGSIVFDTASGDNQIDETTREWFVWHGGPVQDGYALVIKRGQTYISNGFATTLDSVGEVQSYIMDQDGAITCTLPGEYNKIGGFGGGLSGGGFDTQYSLGWCGEGLFAIFENHYDEEWNFFSEAKGYIDSTGDMVLDLSGQGYTNLWPFHGGLAAVRSESGMIGFIDKTGALVIPCIYDDAVTSFSEDGICAVKKDNKWGYIDKDGSEVIPFEYDNAYGAGDGLASVVKDGKCGLVDYSNRIIVPMEYDDISSGEGGTAYAIKDGMLYIISR